PVAAGSRTLARARAGRAGGDGRASAERGRDPGGRAARPSLPEARDLRRPQRGLRRGVRRARARARRGACGRPRSGAFAAARPRIQRRPPRLPRPRRVIETERFLIRPLSTEEAEQLFAQWIDPPNERIDFAPERPSDEQVRRWLGGVWGVWERETG